MTRYAIAIHGGAGTILRSQLKPEQELLYLNTLLAASAAGKEILEHGGSSLDAVEAAVKQLENAPLFNAGKGSVFTHEGTIEMDASVMSGNQLRCGAVAGVRGVKNPVSLARLVMEQSEHVLLTARGAERFGQQKGIEFMPEDYFYTKERYDQLYNAIQKGVMALDHDADQTKKFGTVGAVALDRNGNLAAATSTGGMTNKKFGRIGDTPIIGAGVYANNNTCAVSCTGHGEYFIRAVAAYDVSCLMEYKGCSLKKACYTVVHDKLLKMGGSGGLIAIDNLGNIELLFNSEGMYRASLKEGEVPYVAIYKDNNY
jgi:L-asparaginase / beta-aspartyl-peptidase